MNNTDRARGGADVAIVGGGPAGLQAATVLARTRKRVLVFDSPNPPRNAVSHGVHNFVGAEDLTHRSSSATTSGRRSPDTTPLSGSTATSTTSPATRTATLWSALVRTATRWTT